MAKGFGSNIGRDLVQKYGIVFPTVIVFYLNINLRIPYRVGYWIF